MATSLEELAASLLGQGTQEKIAAANPYYSGRNVADTIGNTAIKAVAQNPTQYGMGETAAVSGISGLLSGLFGSAGDDYQNTLTNRYSDVISGQSDGSNLPSSLFGDAQRQKTLFGISRELQAQEQAQKRGDAVFLENLKNDNEMKKTLFGEIARNPRKGKEILANPSMRSILGLPPAETDTISGQAQEAISPEPAAPETTTMFNNGIESISEKIDNRYKYLLDNEPELTANAALDAAKSAVKGEVAADTAQLKELDTNFEKIRATEQLLTQTEGALAKAGDTGGIGGIGGGIQSYTKWLTDPEAATAMGELGSTGAKFVSAARIPGSGAMSDPEMALYQKSGVSIYNEPEVNQEILKNMKAVNEANKQFMDFKTAYYQEKGTLRGANQFWAKNYLDKVKGVPLTERPAWQDVISQTKVSSGQSAAKSSTQKSAMPSIGSFNNAEDYANAVLAWEGQ